MTGSFVDQRGRSVEATSQNNIALSSNYTPAAGNLVLIAVSYFRGTQPVVTMPTAWGTFIEGGHYFNGSDGDIGCGIRWGIYQNVSASASNAQAAFNLGVDYPGIYIAEFAGLKTSDVLIGNPSLSRQVNPGTSAGAVTVSVTPSEQPAILWGFAFVPSGASNWDTAVSDNGLSRVWDYGGASFFAKPQYARVTSTSSRALTWTTNSGAVTYWSVALALAEAADEDPPPAISSPTPSGVLETETTAPVGCTTDQNSGTLYVVVDAIANISGIDAEQIIAGENVNDDPAVAADSAAVSTTSPSIPVDDLEPDTEYGYAIAQVNDNGTSNVLTGSFTTAEEVIVATKLAVIAQPGNTVVGQTIASVQVAAQNDEDQTDESFDGNITIALQTGSGTLAGTTTKAAVAGVATFNDLSISTLNTGAVLRATSDGLTQVDTTSFNITTGTGSGVGGSLIGSALIS